MPALIYDKTQNAWKEAEKPKIWHPDQNAFGKAEGKIYVPSQNAWKDAWVNRLPDIRLSNYSKTDSNYYDSSSVYVSAWQLLGGTDKYSSYTGQGYKYVSYDIYCSCNMYFNSGGGNLKTGAMNAVIQFPDGYRYPSVDYYWQYSYYNMYANASGHFKVKLDGIYTFIGYSATGVNTDVITSAMKSVLRSVDASVSISNVVLSVD